MQLSLLAGLQIRFTVVCVQTLIVINMPFSLITDLPCLLSLTSCQHILVHSLPDLEPLMHLFFPLLSDIRYTCVETGLVLL